MRYAIFTLFTAFLLFSCKSIINSKPSQIAAAAGMPMDTLSASQEKTPVQTSVSGYTAVSVDPQQFVSYAKSLIGTPYVYGSMNPQVGFDCSGFVNHVAHHFGMQVPRSSVQFTSLGTEIDKDHAQAGDIILFTGTDPSTRIVGHMGIVTDNNEGHLNFVHSSSGKGAGVIMSGLEGYYSTRFVKVIRLLPAA